MSTVLEVELGVARPGVLTGFAGRILPVTVNVAVNVALRPSHLHVPDPRAARDAFIAATADIHGRFGAASTAFVPRGRKTPEQIVRVARDRRARTIGARWGE